MSVASSRTEGLERFTIHDFSIARALRTAPTGGCLSLAAELPCQSTRNRYRMSCKSSDSPEHSFRLMKYAYLPQHGGAIVIDSFPGQAVVGVERVHATKRELDSFPCRGKAAPVAQMRATNHHFQQNGIVSNVLALNLDLQVRQRLHQLLIKLADSGNALVVFAPCFVVVLCGVAESAENSRKIVGVLQPNVLLDDRDAGRLPVFRN
jgi:hypothetical protein